MTQETVYIFQGQPLAPHLKKRALSKLHDVEPNDLDVRYDYVVRTSKPFDEQRRHKTLALLQAQDKKPKGNLWVVPRKGTISPWSSKTTQLANVCGLDVIESIELALAFDTTKTLSETQIACLFDRMTHQSCIDLMQWVQHEDGAPSKVAHVDVLGSGIEALIQANQTFGLALSSTEMDYLCRHYTALEKNPTDAELMMFAQVNSEHCRHKIFNATWTIDGHQAPSSLFGMIRSTHEHSNEGIWSAYSDNAAVIEGLGSKQMQVVDGIYQHHHELLGTLIKVETHNHPTAIAPFEGAGTGSGGELRDEGATGIGGQPKVGLTGFSVSHLNLDVPWFEAPSLLGPSRMATPLDIMIKAPVGASAYNNEFGRPNVCGYFRSFEYHHQGQDYGYHKPVMIAGGLGQIRQSHSLKKDIPVDSLVLVLGGPCMQIGVGGGAASSMKSGQSSADLDFASVQRQDPQMQRRAQQVINAMIHLGEQNPILSIHDVGAGGLSNALPELVHDADKGANFELRDIPNAEPAMSPLGIWCCEAQERYVFAIDKKDLSLVQAMAQRERCPVAVVGHAIEDKHLRVWDEIFGEPTVDVPLSLILNGSPKLHKTLQAPQNQELAKITLDTPLNELLPKVLAHPTVADKSFLVTIGDRSVGGLVAQDQMVGPYQVPVADCAIALTGFDDETGEVMAMGERSPVAVLNAKASTRLALAETITNMMGADIERLSDITVSCNWMAACGQDQEDYELYEGVQSVTELCKSLDVCIPVGKDSLSMKTQWEDNGHAYSVKSPLTLIVSGFSKAQSLTSLTPYCKGQGDLYYVNLSHGQRRLGGSVAQQVTNQLGGPTPDVDAGMLKAGFELVKQARREGWASAYHDVSDGGLITTLAEMGFCTQKGLSIDLNELELESKEVLSALFSEELGFVIQVEPQHKSAFIQFAKTLGLNSLVKIASFNKLLSLKVVHGKELLLDTSLSSVRAPWSQTSFEIQRRRDGEEVAQCELEAKLEPYPLYVKNPPSLSPAILTQKPKVAILREQGVNGHVEMANAFMQAGFEAFDVHMSDLLESRFDLNDVQVLAACGGFSYGDVLGAGRGWASSILYHESLKESFAKFFEREDTLTLGVCNGCQMLSQLKEIIPGASHFPTFEVNLSTQFEARLSMVQIHDNDSPWLSNMGGAHLPVVVSHGEGRVTMANQAVDSLVTQKALALSYTHPKNQQATEIYPYNPNGSTQGVTGLTTTTGQVLIMMPHPERVTRNAQLSWYPESKGMSPWLQLFHNAAKRVQ